MTNVNTKTRNEFHLRYTSLLSWLVAYCSDGNLTESTMTLQWTFIAVFLYLEIFIIALFLLPFIPPSRWQKIFRSGLVTTLSAYSNIYFNVFIAILVLLFADAFREVRKYADPISTVDMKNNPDQEVLAHMKLFRAQRNLYIAGFALFLWFIIRRLVTLNSTQARLLADCEASKKQAQSATDTARKLMEDMENKTNKGKEDTTTETDKKQLSMKLEETKAELAKTKKELDTAQKDLKAVKKQAEGTNTEYDRVMKELAQLQAKLSQYEGAGDKKSN